MLAGKRRDLQTTVTVHTNQKNAGINDMLCHLEGKRRSYEEPERMSPCEQFHLITNISY